MTSRSLNLVRKFAIVLAFIFVLTACGGNTSQIPTSSTTPLEEPMPMPLIELNPDLPEGDPEKGYPTAIQYGCAGCHVDDENPESAPRFVSSDGLPNIFERGELRITDPDYEGRAASNWEYIIESIHLPQSYFVPGDWGEQMSIYTIHKMSDQELADIIAWMGTLE